MAESRAGVERKGLGVTMRRDAWWIELLPVVVVLGLFGLYATLRAVEGAYYEWGPICRPSTRRSSTLNHHWWPFSPALLILGAPLGFRSNLLLLPQGLLPGFLPRPACLRGGRTSPAPLPWRDLVPVYPSEPAPLLSLPGADLRRRSLVRRDPGILVRWEVRDRRWVARSSRQHHPADPLRILVSLAETYGGWKNRLLLLRGVWRPAV